MNLPARLDSRIAARLLLATSFNTPEHVRQLDGVGWDLLIRQARSEQLLAKLCMRLEEGGLLGDVPEAPRRHLESARIYARKYEQDVRRELVYVRDALSRAGIGCILLKGAAYIAAGLPAAEGRTFSDIDVLVPRKVLSEAEAALRRAGWRATKLDSYDQKYYRRWMHELPPMRHAKRRSVLDVHHTILPPTAKPRVDAALILANAKPTPLDGILVLAPEDMLIHAAAHLFHDGFFHQGLRELVDIASLLRHFAGNPAFWPRLATRAIELDLGRPLWYALRYSADILGAPAAPEEAKRLLDQAAPPPVVRTAMDLLMRRALRPAHASCGGPDVRLSRFLLYVRSHYLRMPLRLLLPHLARKAMAGIAPANRRPA